MNQIDTRENFTVQWNYEKNVLKLIDQRNLPESLDFVEFSSVEAVSDAIRDMVVRGAPAIGAAGAFGMALAAFSVESDSCDAILSQLQFSKLVLDHSRPTAVNLSWATAVVLEAAKQFTEKIRSLKADRLKMLVLKEAQALADDDVKVNKRMGKYGAELIGNNAKILHHCNTGSLATVYWGTALGVIFELNEQGKFPFVYVDETRPRLQGAKLTAFELLRNKIQMQLIADNAAGFLMHKKEVEYVLVGADRVCSNGDVANKIGTYKLAVCAKYNNIKFYPVVPTSTIDLNLKHGDEILIEERSASEITEINGVRIAPENCPVFNPAFDVTPNQLVTAIITEQGICYPPFEISLKAAKEAAEKQQNFERQKRIQEIICQENE